MSFHGFIDRGPGVQVGINRLEILRRQLAQVQPRHQTETLRPNSRRAMVRVVAVLIDAIQEISLTPAADACLEVGADVRADYQHSRRRAERLSTG